MNYKFKRENIKSLRDIAYEAIRDAILSNHLAAGEKLTEADLSKQLGISRGPIREAFRQLERDGLVQSQPYKGTVVAEFDTEEAKKVYVPIRQLVEQYACSRAATVFQEEDYEYLNQCISKMEEDCAQRDVETISKDDAEFHRYIVTKCSSCLLTSIWESLAAHFYGRIFFQDRLKQEKPEFSYIPKEHTELIAAMKTGDEQAIMEIIKVHIQ